MGHEPGARDAERGPRPDRLPSQGHALRVPVLLQVGLLHQAERLLQNHHGEPFLVNYSGAIYREYPQDWQVLLEDTLGQRKYKTVGSSKDSYTLFQAKEIMMEAMGLKGDEGPALELLRTGYKTCTWWEDPKDYDREVSDNWRK